jgi:hypothetical protein
MYNILNLVFDDWENNIPKENLHLLNKRKNQYFKLPFFLMDQKKIKINACTISDINLNQDFYYFIRNFAYDNFFNEENWLIPNHIENLIKTKNLKVIFFNEHESYNNLKESIKELSIIINKKQLNEEQFYVINNNINIYNIQKELNTKINVFKTDYLLEQYPNYLMLENKIEINYNKEWLFLCHNKKPKTHRFDILTLLKYENLLEYGIVDYSITYGKINREKIKNEIKNKTFIDVEGANEKLKRDYNEIRTIRKNSYYEENKYTFGNNGDTRIDIIGSVQQYEKTYFNIITESHYEEVDIHVTEKTFKPFYLYQYPIFVASHNHIKTLKEHYDFYLFDDLIDHSYDNEIDSGKRLYKIVEEIKRLSKMKNEIELHYKSNIEKLVHNNNVIKQIANEERTINFFLNLSNKIIYKSVF